MKTQNIFLSAEQSRKIMNRIVGYTLVLFSMIAAGCGGAADEHPTTPEPLLTPQTELVETPPPPPPQPTKPAPIMRTESYEQNLKCRVDEQEDGTIQVVSDEADWFLYASATAQVECGTFGGKVKIVDGPLTIKVESLIPKESSGKIEAELRERATQFIETEMADKYKNTTDLVFEQTKVGRKKRPALCIDTDLDMDGFPGKIVACVTSKKNVNDEVVVHRAYWVGTIDQYDAKETVQQVKKESASWYRYSDTDMMGKILNSW